MLRLTVFGLRTWVIMNITGFLITYLALPAWGDDSPNSRATLKGISALSVLVEEIDPDAEKDGLTRDQLQADVELRLPMAGIKIDPSALSYLYIHVGTQKREGGL